LPNAALRKEVETDASAARCAMISLKACHSVPVSRHLEAKNGFGFRILLEPFCSVFAAIPERLYLADAAAQTLALQLL
jgi:hypothetical protein